jgi:hypothetical protein
LAYAIDASSRATRVSRARPIGFGFDVNHIIFFLQGACTPTLDRPEEGRALPDFADQAIAERGLETSAG